MKRRLFLAFKKGVRDGTSGMPPSAGIYKHGQYAQAYRDGHELGLSVDERGGYSSGAKIVTPQQVAPPPTGPGPGSSDAFDPEAMPSALMQEWLR